MAKLILNKVYDLKLWVFLLLLAATNIAGIEEGYETGGEQTSCEECEEELLSGISLSPSFVTLLEAGLKKTVKAQINHEEGAQWSLEKEERDFLSTSFSHVTNSGKLDPATGTSTTLSFEPATEMYVSGHFFQAELRKVRESWLLTGKPLGEASFLINHRWITVEGINPHVKWMAGPSVASFLGHTALVVPVGTQASALIQVVNSTPSEVWGGWTIAQQDAIPGVALQIVPDSDMRARATVTVAPNFYALNGVGNLGRLTAQTLQVGARRVINPDRMWNRIGKEVGELKLRVPRPPPPA